MPDEYSIGLMDFDLDDLSIMVFGTKNEASVDYAKKARLDPEQVANLEVVCLFTRGGYYMAASWCPDVW